MSSIFNKKQSMAQRMADSAKAKAAMKAYWASKEGKKNVKTAMGHDAPKGHSQHKSRGWNE